jgi:hypothetical protein
MRAATLVGLALMLCGCAGRSSASATGRTTARFHAPEELLLVPAESEAPRPIVPAAPRYPHDERGRREAVTVVAAFVVDTAGNVEYRTVTFLETAAAPFLRSICDALSSARFAAAGAPGRPQRSLVVTGFGFAVFQDGPREPPRPDVASYQRALANQPRDSVIARLERSPHCP